MVTMDNSIKSLLSNVLDISGEERQTTITAIIQDRQNEKKINPLFQIIKKIKEEYICLNI